jgi:hypothetical protein
LEINVALTPFIDSPHQPLPLLIGN